MALEEIAQLVQDFEGKREVLSEHRNKINKLQKDLLRFASQSLPKEDLSDLEHYQNQFHIQLINIHDLRHDLKIHLQRLRGESQIHEGITPESVEQHKELESQFNTLETLLSDLENDFSEFLSKPHEVVA